MKIRFRTRTTRLFVGAVLFCGTAAAYLWNGSIDRAGSDKQHPARITHGTITTESTAPEAALANLAASPLRFEVNSGQTDAQVKFISRSHGGTLFLTKNEAVIRPHVGGERKEMRLRLVEADPALRIVGEDALPTRSNYFVGDRSRWAADVANYSRVRYEQVYPNVDQVFYGTGRDLEYDFVVGPGGDYRQIGIEFAGAQNVELNADGDLELKLGTRSILQKKPFVYQEIDGKRVEIPSAYAFRDSANDGKPVVGFDLGEYDTTRTLIIDPVLVYSTYLGGSRSDGGRAITVDTAGNVYITGNTDSADFPGAGSSEPPQAGFSDVFITKMNPEGTAILFSTYFGGGAGDIGYGIDTDSVGNIYVTGVTGGTNGANSFPTTAGAFDRVFNAPDESFLAKFGPTGSLVYSTYTGATIGFEVKADKVTGETYVAGNAGTILPTTPGAFMTACPCGPSNAFVSKFNSSGSALVYSTYIGAGVANDLAVDAAGNSYVTGSTISTAFPITPGAAQPTCTGCNLGRSDAFVTKLNASGTAVDYSTFLGGSQGEVGRAIALDSGGNAYVTGRTESSALSTVPFPTTPGAFQPASPGIPDPFVTKLNPAGTAFVYSTYVGGNVRDEAFGLAVDGTGNAHVIGQTRSTNFTLVDPVQTICPQNGDCVFIASLNPAGSGLIFSTFFGQGEGIDVAADTSGSIFATGVTYRGLANLPTMNPIQATHGGDATNGSAYDGFVSKFRLTEAPGVSVTGRVLTPDGRSLRNAVVRLTYGDGSSRIAVTSSFGTYSFDNVRSGDTITLTVSSKRYRFAPKQVASAGDQTGVDFVGLE